MSANLGSLPGSTSAVAQLALSGTGTSGNAASDESGTGPFAALFQQMLGTQIAPEGAAALLILPSEGASSAEMTDEKTAGDLNALLPFLEAMGLAQAASTIAPIDEHEDLNLPQMEPGPVPAVLAAAVTPQMTNQPAISAAQTGASAGDANRLTNSTVVVEDALAEVAITPAKPDGGQQSGTMSEGKDFGSQLVAAIEGNKEPSQNPLDTANTAHQAGFGASSRNEVLAAAPQLPVAQAVGSARWSDAVGNQVVWMANRQESRAELVLNPPQMGRVEVSLSVSGEQATASFVSSNPAVREALEAALPRLREILADAGIQLGQAQVGAENARQSGQQEKEANRLGNSSATQPENKGIMTATQTTPATSGLKLGRGLVDVFA